MPSTGCRNSHPTACQPGNSSRSGERNCPFGRDPETHCGSPARARRCRQDPCCLHQERSAPAPPSAGMGSGWRCGRGDGPCHGNGAGGSDSVVPPRSGREKETHCVFPARAERCHQDPCHPHQQRSAPDPAGEKRPPGAGRALAGGFGPRLAKDQRGAMAGAMAPANAAGLVVRTMVFRPAPGGTPKRTVVPPPARGAAAKTRAARTKRGQRPPVADVQAGRARAEGFLAPGSPGVSLALWQGRWPLPG